MSNVDYRKKYMELRSVLISTVDQSFRAGYQQGMADAQVEQMMQQQQAQAEQEAAMAQQGIVDPEDQQQQVMEGAADAHQENGVSELEAGINELEQELGKAEGVDKQLIASQLSNLNASLKKIMEAQELKKSAAHIKKMKTANTKLKGLSVGYKSNLKDTHKKAISAQTKIVSDIMKKWESEEQNVASGIAKILESENKVK